MFGKPEGIWMFRAGQQMLWLLTEESGWNQSIPPVKIVRADSAAQALDEIYTQEAKAERLQKRWKTYSHRVLKKNALFLSETL